MTNDRTNAAAHATANDTQPLEELRDPVIAYLQGDPDPLTEFTESDFQRAESVLKDTASHAVADANGYGWVPGLSIVVVRRKGNDFVPTYYHYGTRRVGHTDMPVDENTLFPCASLSKPVSTTLVAAAALEEARKKAQAGEAWTWSWDVPVYRPDANLQYHLANGHGDTTLRQWLSHLSGLPGHAGDLIEDMNSVVVMKRDELLNNVQQYQTGIHVDEYHYTNMGFTMGCIGAAKALGLAAGQAWETFAQGWLRDLGMTASTYVFESAYHDTAKRAFPHQGKPDVPDLFKVAETGWTWHVTSEADERNPRRQSPAGSLLSTASDLGIFLTHHLKKEFDGKSSFPPRDLTTAEQKGRYSLGWNVTNRSAKPGWGKANNAVSFSHSGAFSLGAGTYLRFDPDMGIGLAILSNGEPTAVPEALGQLFFKTLYKTPLPPGCTPQKVLAVARAGYMGMLYGQKGENYERYHAKPAIKVPARIAAKDLVFTGHSDYFGCNIMVAHRPISPADPGVYLYMGKDKDGNVNWGFTLRCIDDNPSTTTFVYETRGENEVGLSAVKLNWQGDVVDSITDDWLNSQGEGLGVINRSKA